MASRQKHIFVRNKPQINIYSIVNEEGKQIETREDSEQQVAYHEIVEALIKAGYYRAQVQGLSPFDKIVGGMSWCIEICDIDIDIDLLFQENLTIGKKIALTEKIVSVLPLMQCPFTIEPHQIQGLDFINIYPLIQWLIKHSDEFREAKEDELKRFAIAQFDKDLIFKSDVEGYHEQKKVLRNIMKLKDIYKPYRENKRKKPYPKGELEKVTATLSEYGQRLLIQEDQGDNDDEGINSELLAALHDWENKAMEGHHKWLSSVDKHDYNKDLSNTELSDRKLHYAILQSELNSDISETLEKSEKVKYSNEISSLKEKLQEELQKRTQAMSLDHKEILKEEIKKNNSLKQILEALMKIDNIRDTEANINSIQKTLASYNRQKEELKRNLQEKNREYLKLKDVAQDLNNKQRTNNTDTLTPEELKEYDENEGKMKKVIGMHRLKLAKLNREVLLLNAAIDDVPSQVELVQYERRFLELYDQVADKHKETKQFYTFYNTLCDVKLYVSKELSLLNSILDNYHEAMSAPKKREQFMEQLESIVEWVKQTVRKTETKYLEEKDKRDKLSKDYNILLEINREYMTTLKRLAEERKHFQRIAD